MAFLSDIYFNLTPPLPVSVLFPKLKKAFPDWEMPSDEAVARAVEAEDIIDGPDNSSLEFDECADGECTIRTIMYFAGGNGYSAKDVRHINADADGFSEKLDSAGIKYSDDDLDESSAKRVVEALLG